MKLDSFTTKARSALESAVEMAQQRENPNVEVEHLLLAILNDTDGVVAGVLSKLEVNSGQVYQSLMVMVQAMPQAHGGQTTLGDSILALFPLAEKEATRFKDDFVATEHLFLAILETPKGKVPELLKIAGITPESFLLALKELRGNVNISAPDAESRYKSLERYSIDLTARARMGSLDPVIGRDDEIRRVIQELSRRRKNTIPCAGQRSSSISLRVLALRLCPPVLTTISDCSLQYLGPWIFA